MERLRSTIKYFLTVTINLQRDKANHAFDLLLVYSLIALFSPLIALGVVLLIALAKEVWDYFGNGTPDVWDIVAGITSPIVIFLLQLLIESKG